MCPFNPLRDAYRFPGTPLAAFRHQKDKWTVRHHRRRQQTNKVAHDDDGEYCPCCFEATRDFVCMVYLCLSQ